MKTISTDMLDKISGAGNYADNRDRGDSDRL